MLNDRCMNGGSEHPRDEASSGENRRPLFTTTHWSVVLATGAAESSRAQEAVSRLCRSYWYPLYAYVRRRGCSAEDAEDLTQEFFARLLEKQSLAHLTRHGGRFRSFLLKSLDHFLVEQWRRARTQKRGGGQVISLDAASAETRYRLEPADEHTPETLFDRARALALPASVFYHLQAGYSSESPRWTPPARNPVPGSTPPMNTPRKPSSTAPGRWPSSPRFSIICKRNTPRSEERRVAKEC